MPRASRVRHVTHHASAKLKQNIEEVGKISVVSDDLPFAEAQSESLRPPLPSHQTKKEKQLEKREAFLQSTKLEPSTQTFSKSHERRKKRKAKEQLAGDTLDDLQSALATLEKDAEDAAPSTTIAESQDLANAGSTKSQIKPGTIGEGRSAPLTKAQRKRAFELERLRHPLILTNPEFSANPFKTIRTHAQNTLLKHETPA